MAKQQQSVQPMTAQALGLKQGGGSQSTTGSAIQLLVQQMGKSFNSMMSAVTQLQAANAQSVQDAAGSVAGSVGDVLNKASAGIDQRRAKEEAKTEKKEDRQYNEQFLQYQQDLMQQGAREMAEIQATIQQQQDSYRNFAQEFERQKSTVAAGATAILNRADQLAENGYWESVPDGPARYGRIVEWANHALAMNETHYNAKYLAAAQSDLNQAIQDIHAGRDPMDLTTMEVNPLLLPMPQVSRSEGELPVLGPDDLRRMERTQGYPEGGLLSPDPNDPMLPHVSPFTMESIVRSMMSDEILNNLTTKKARKEYLEGTFKMLDQADKAVRPMIDLEEKLAETHRTIAPDAVQRGIEEFVSSGAYKSSADPAKDLSDRIVLSMIGVENKPIMQLAEDYLAGKVPPDQMAKEHWYALTYVKSAKREAENFIMADATKPDSQLLTSIVDQAMSSDPNLLANLRLQFQPTSKTGKLIGGKPGPGQTAVAARRAYWKLLGGAKSRLTRDRLALQETGPIKSLTKDIGAQVRLRDAALTAYMSTTDPIQKEAVRAQMRGDMENLSGEDLKANESGTERFRRGVSMLEGMALLYSQLPQGVVGLSEMINMKTKPEAVDRNFEAFNQTIKFEATRDPYFKAVYDRYEQGKLPRSPMFKDNQAQGQSPQGPQPGGPGMSGPPGPQDQRMGQPQPPPAQPGQPPQTPPQQGMGPPAPQQQGFGQQPQGFPGQPNMEQQ